MTEYTITTERLRLRSVTPTDVLRLHECVFSDPDVMTLAFSGRTFSVQETTGFITDRFDQDGSGRRPGVLEAKDSGDLIGFAGLMPCRALGEDDYEIGFVLARRYWGQGFASEIGKAQLDFGFDRVGCARLLALAAPQNLASSAVLRKLGMTYESSLEDDVRGKRNVYRIHRSDWSKGFDRTTPES